MALSLRAWTTRWKPSTSAAGSGWVSGMVAWVLGLGAAVWGWGAGAVVDGRAEPDHDTRGVPGRDARRVARSGHEGGGRARTRGACGSALARRPTRHPAAMRCGGGGAVGG